MKIKKVKYLDNLNDGVNITFEDKTTFQIPTQSERYQYTDALNEWLKAGNKTQPYKTEEEFLLDAKEQKIVQINSECENTIIGGFKSSALGSEHLYESKKEDQLNLSGLKERGIENLLKCSFDEGKTWEWKAHTFEQIKEVFYDGVDFKQEQLKKAFDLKAKVKSATTVEELEKIDGIKEVK